MNRRRTQPTSVDSDGAFEERIHIDKVLGVRLTRLWDGSHYFEANVKYVEFKEAVWSGLIPWAAPNACKEYFRTLPETERKQKEPLRIAYHRFTAGGSIGCPNWSAEDLAKL